MQCDYYVAMFRDLTTLDGQYYKNDYDPVDSSFEIKNDTITVPPSSEGMVVTNTDRIKVKEWDLEKWNSVSFQYMFKGTISTYSSSNGAFLLIDSGGGQTDQALFLKRYGNHIVVGTTFTSSSTNATLSEVFLNANTNWMYIGASVGWLGDENEDKFMLCAYFYQAGNTEQSGCVYTTSYDKDKFEHDDNIKFELREHIGIIKEIYVLDYLQVPSVFELTKTLTANQRYP